MHFIIFALSFTYTFMPYLLQKKNRIFNIIINSEDF